MWICENCILFSLVSYEITRKSCLLPCLHHEAGSNKSNITSWTNIELCLHLCVIIRYAYNKIFCYQYFEHCVTHGLSLWQLCIWTKYQTDIYRPQLSPIIISFTFQLSDCSPWWWQMIQEHTSIFTVLFYERYVPGTEICSFISLK